MRSGRILQALLLAIWFGGSLFIVIIAAPVVFQRAPTREAAGSVVGGMLQQWYWVSMAVPVILIAAALSQDFSSVSSRRAPLLLLTAALVFSLCRFVVDGRIHAIRDASPVPVSSLSAADPLRKRFGRLHGMSSLLLLAETATAGALIAISANEREPRPFLS